MVKGARSAARGRPRRAAGLAADAAYNYKHGGSHAITDGSAAAAVAKQRDRTRRQAPRLFEDPANDERLLNAQLRRLGLYAANTLGDGSCLFRALSDQLHGTPNYHHVIRQEVCNFLLAHSSEFIAFIDDSNHSSPEAAFAAHVAEMRLQATYGTQVEIVAFARMVSRRVRVIQAQLVYVIGYEDESPSAKSERAAGNVAKGKAREKEASLPDLYIVYHNWEHYSSARNVQGPHSGLPCIIDAKQAASGDNTPSSTEDEPTATQEESLVLSSLKYPHRHNITEIRQLIQDCAGSWEQALETLIENEIDETESEDFNNPSPGPTNTTEDYEAVDPASVPLPSSHPSIRTPLHNFQHHQPPQPSGLSVSHTHRSSSPSASSSTATSTTHLSTSTTATQLSDLPLSHDHNLRQKASASPSCGSRIRSRATSPDPEIQAAESPRQRFRITRERDEDASSSVGGAEDFATLESSSVASAHSASPSSTADGDGDRDRTAVEVTAGAAAVGLPLAETVLSPTTASPRKRGRPLKKREGVTAKQPTRRQRKDLAKTVRQTESPVGARTRSRIPLKEEVGLQRDFKELYV